MRPTQKNLKIIDSFVVYCVQNLNIKAKKIDLTLSLVQQDSNAPTAGSFNPQTMEISVCIKHRAIADCLRTIAHELTHFSQAEKNIEFPTDDEGLQPLEDEANVMSGRLVRFFGRMHREIYADLK